MDSNSKQLMAVFSLMLGLSWGIPYVVSESDDRNSGWLMLAVLFLLIALGFYLWIMREQRTAEDAANDALDAAEENLKKLEEKAAQADDEPTAVSDRDLPSQKAAPDIGLPQTASATDIEEALSEDDSEEPIEIDAQAADEPVTDIIEAPPTEIIEEPVKEVIPVSIEDDDAGDSSATDDDTIEEAEALAEEAEDGDLIAKEELADDMAAPDTPPEPDIEMDNKTADDSALAQSHSTAEDDDDLERIEGIGPRYAEILTEAGVNTYAQIASMTEDDIVDLIKSNGGRKSASMSTWAEQAKLAAAGDWDGLEKLQNDLDGGRRS